MSGEMSTFQFDDSKQWGEFEERKKNLLEEFRRNGDGLYPLLIQKGKILPGLPSGVDRDHYRFPGCLNNVWLYPVYENGTIRIYAESDSRIVKGALAGMAQLLSGLSPSAILNANLDFYYTDVLLYFTHSVRVNTIKNVENIIKAYARRYQSLER